MRKTFTDSLIILTFWSVVLLSCMYMAGCDPSDPTNTIMSSYTVDGMVQDVTISGLNESTMLVIVKFDDGRLVRLRASYDQPLTFKIGALNVITYNYRSMITNIKVD